MELSALFPPFDEKTPSSYPAELLRVAKLQASLPAAVEILYSLKANASLGICDVLADCGIGADVASAFFPARRC